MMMMMSLGTIAAHDTAAQTGDAHRVTQRGSGGSRVVPHLLPSRPPSQGLPSGLQPQRCVQECRELLGRGQGECAAHQRVALALNLRMWNGGGKV